MISSISPWRPSLSEMKRPHSEADLAQAAPETVVPAPAADAANAVDDGVRSKIVSGMVGGGASASGSGAEEDDEIEVIYNTVVQPDGSKLLQVITKYPDGSTRVTTAKLPGTKDDESGFSKEVFDLIKTDGDDDDSSGERASEIVADDAISAYQGRVFASDRR